MKIVILDGALESSPASFESYLGKLKNELIKADYTVEHFILKDLEMRHCIGCFDCWVKTPGQCVFDDASREINRALINADFLLFATPLVMGFASYVLKRKMDRIIPLIHPYITIVEDESHHLARYDKYPLIGLLMQPDGLDNEENITITSQIFARTALNFKSRLAFAATTVESPQEVAARFENLKVQNYAFNRDIPEKSREIVGPLHKLVVFNGSPRGKKGNTPFLLEKLSEGFTASTGREVETHHLFRTKDVARFAKAFKDAECAMIGFPLYTDGMPGLVKEFIDELEPLVKRGKNPPIAFLVQSGFSENHHSRYIQRYLESLAERLNSPYLGTLVRGGCEGVRMMPEKMNRKKFAALSTLGGQLAEAGGFSDHAIKEFGAIERYPRFLIPLIRLLVKTPFMHMYWNNQLKRNNAFDKRFDRPYQE